MKFCKVLEDQDRDLPELQHLFLRYKALKKKINAIGAAASDAAANHGIAADGGDVGPSSVASSGLSTEETEFVATLNEDLERFNSFFMEKEEEEVIKIQALADRLESATSTEELSDVTQGLINLHGELVLVLHWSLINYSAIVKILKKHDKRTGVFLRAPYLANVLQQPFASTNMMSRLVKRAEQLVSNAIARARMEGIAEQRDGHESCAEAKYRVAAEMPPDDEIATTTGTGDTMAAAAAAMASSLSLSSSSMLPSSSSPLLPSSEDSPSVSPPVCLSRALRSSASESESSLEDSPAPAPPCEPLRLRQSRRLNMVERSFGGSAAFTRARAFNGSRQALLSWLALGEPHLSVRNCRQTRARSAKNGWV
uniref:SPX domain-containing protein n=1 Tax=Chlamydomonas euryale TaxID=1486919 RepID=A0A7R9YT16_9CHLO|mmetsp:Transcript_20553/g.61286  ORF Transcript_20553/g.61286 Transcript_20553/m.61286 type:complete len:369 (+) Transcript_20553:223-1329(+)